MIATENDDMQRDYAYTVNRDFNLLQSAEEVGKQAAYEALSRLHSQQLATGMYPVMFRADIANTMFGHFIAAISGGNLYRKSSFLLDAIDQKVFPEFLTITEKPFIPKALASTPFDNEGVRPIERNIIEQGVLKSYLLTSYSARKLGLKTTGNAGGIHNWQLTANGGDFNSMLQQLGTGLLVTELMGQGVNIVNGDYSRGAAGFWVENGKIQYPVSEITIAGNLKDIFTNLIAVGNDIDNRGSIQTGSLLFSAMQVAGN
jgi:PmbA protein